MVCITVLGYLAHRAAVREAEFSQSDNFSWRVVADHVEVMLQRRVFGPLEVNQLCCFIHPNLRAAGALHKKEKTQTAVIYFLFILIRRLHSLP